MSVVAEDPVLVEDVESSSVLSRPFWPQFSDEDDSPSIGVRLLDYFSQEAEFLRRRCVIEQL